MILDQTYKIEIPTYPLCVVISFTQKKQLFKQEIKTALGLKNTKVLSGFNTHFNNPDFKNHGRTARLSSGNIVVSLTSIDHGIIAHELLHATTLLLDAVGVVFSIDSNEVYAYLMQYLTSIVYKILEENEGVFSTEQRHQGIGPSDIQDKTEAA